ncbi:hypothetical protein M153_54030002, partial [Pseudoloma neurophilia]
QIKIKLKKIAMVTPCPPTFKKARPVFFHFIPTTSMIGQLTQICFS